MRLYLMRHADAGEPPRGGSDGDRHLSSAGRRQAADAARALLGHAGKIDAIFTSSLVRAVQTGEIVASALGFDGLVEVLVDLASGCPPDMLLHAVPRGRGDVLLVGHEPSLGSFASWLLSRQVPPFAKTAVMAVEVTAQDPPAKLLWLLPPGGAPQTSLP